MQKHKTGLCPSVYTGHSVRYIVCQKFNDVAKAQSIQDFNPKSFVDYFIVTMYFYYNNIMTLSDPYINQKKWKQANDEDPTISPELDSIIVDHDLNLQTEDVQDPQVAIWKEGYGIWSDELDVALIGECKYLFNHEKIVHPCSQWHFLSQIFYRIIPFPL